MSRVPAIRLATRPGQTSHRCSFIDRFAHDNVVLNYDESLLIFNHVASAIRFIEAVELRIWNADKQVTSKSEQEDGIPF